MDKNIKKAPWINQEALENYRRTNFMIDFIKFFYVLMRLEKDGYYRKA